MLVLLKTVLFRSSWNFVASRAKSATSDLVRGARTSLTWHKPPFRTPSLPKGTMYTLGGGSTGCPSRSKAPKLVLEKSLSSVPSGSPLGISMWKNCCPGVKDIGHWSINLDDVRQQAQKTHNYTNIDFWLLQRDMTYMGFNGKTTAVQYAAYSTVQ